MITTLAKKLEKLQTQKQRLEEEFTTLTAQRNEALAHFLKALPPHTLDPDVLLGGILFVLQEAPLNPERQAGWRQAGRTFWRRHQRRTARRFPTPAADKEEAAPASASQPDPSTV